MKMKYIVLLVSIISALSANAQFTGTDSLRNYNNRYVTTNPATAFTNNRLNTLLRGIIDFIDTARAGGGGAIQLGIDTVFAVNDSTIRYRKNGVFRQFTLKGVYDSRRKVDTIYKFNDTTLRFTVNGGVRTVIIPGGTNLNLATSNQSATGNRIHNWNDHWLYLNNVKSFDINTEHADPNHLDNTYKFQLITDSTTDGVPIKLMWGLRNIDDGLTDSVHFELSSTSTATTLYHSALDSTKVARIDLNAGAITPDMQVNVKNASKTSSFRFGQTAIINPSDSLTLKAIPAANADSVLAVRAVNGSVNTVVKIPATSIITTLSNVGTGHRLVTTPIGSIKTISSGYGVLLDSTTTANTLTAKADTSSANHVITQSDLNDAIAGAGTPPAGDDYSIQFKDGTSLGGDSIKYNPSTNNLVMTKSYLQFGRPVTGFFTSSDATSSSGYLWKVYPRGSGGTGADTLEHFYSLLETTKYHASWPENPVLTIFGSKRDGIVAPRWSMRAEGNFFNDREFHLASTPVLMPNVNEEIRHWSWNIGRIDGLSVLATRTSSTYWNESKVGSTYDRQYALLSPAGLTLNTWQTAIGNISVQSGNGASTSISVGINADTTDMAANLFTNANAAALNIGTGFSIGNPATTGGNITANKTTLINNKMLSVVNLANSSTGLAVQSAAQGYNFSASTDAVGWADVITTGKFSVNRDNTISAADRLLVIYNHYNFNDSIFHVRGNGDIWTKGMISARADSTTSATGGFVYRDATTGNFRITASPSGITSINSKTGPAITIQSGTATSIDNSVANTITVNVTPSSNSIPHTLDALYTTAGNTGTSETDLYSYSVPASKLAIDGRTVNFEIDGEFNDNTATAQLKLYFGGNVTLNTGAVNISTANTGWRLKGYIIRTSSTTAHVTYELHAPGLATTLFVGYNNLTSLDFTAGNIFKVTAQAGGAGAGNNDITAHSWQVLYKPQPQ